MYFCGAMAENKKDTKKKVPARRPRRKKKSSGGAAAWLKNHWIGLSVTAGVVVVVLVMAAWLGLGYYSGEDVWVHIPKYASEKAIEDSLRNKLGDSTADKVMTLYRLQNGNPHNSYGAYLIKNGDANLMISRRLKSRKQTPIKISFQGARTMEQIYAKITENLELSPNDFKNACITVLPDLGYKTEAEFPAAFIPDTYEVYWAIDGRELVNKLHKESDRFWTDARKARAKELGVTPIEVATIASIVEEETAKADERPKVARLYLNRIKKGMKLQADPTVKFATGDFSLRRITGEHLKIESPYNTYIHAGLPPGPIRVPDRATLLAVLEAPEHNYLYMCAKEDFSGYHNFAVDYATHQANAARYQAELNRRNIH